MFSEKGCEQSEVLRLLGVQRRGRGGGGRGGGGEVGEGKGDGVDV